MNADTILDRFKNAKADRSPYDNLIEQARYWAYPSAVDITGKSNPGGENRETVFSTVQRECSIKLASGIFSYLMPVDMPWFSFKSKRYDEEDNQELKRWYDTAARRTQEEIGRSNFRTEMFPTLRSLAAMGNGAISLEKGTKSLLNFKSHPIFNVYPVENADGVIDSIFRRQTWTAKQAKEKFGNNLGMAIEKALESPTTENKKFDFVHYILPNEKSFKNSKRKDNKAFVGYYVNIADKKIVKIDYYDEQNFLYGRFYRVEGELLGRGPTTENLPEIKMLDRMRETFIVGAERHARPPIMVEDDGVLGPMPIGPDSVIQVRTGAQYPQVLQTGVDVALTAEVIKEQIQLIREVYYIDRFESLTDYRNMTATEVLERTREKLTMLSPVVGRLQMELFNPLIMRSVCILIRNKVIPQPPVEIEDIEIVYLGQLALAMKNLETSAIIKTLSEFAPYLQVDPTLMDVFKFEAGFRSVGENNGVPSVLLNTDDEIEEIRENRAQAQQAQQQAEMIPELAKAYSQGTKAPEQGSPSDLLMKAM